MLTSFISDYMANRNHVQDRFGRSPQDVFREYGLGEAEQQLLRGSLATLSNHVHEEFVETTGLKAIVWGVEEEGPKQVGTLKAAYWGVEEEGKKQLQSLKAAFWGVEEGNPKQIQSLKAAYWGVEEGDPKQLQSLKAAYWGVEEGDPKPAT